MNFCTFTIFQRMYINLCLTQYIGFCIQDSPLHIYQRPEAHPFRESFLLKSTWIGPSSRNMYSGVPTYYRGVPPPPPGNHKRLPGNIFHTSISPTSSTYCAGVLTSARSRQPDEEQGCSMFTRFGVPHQHKASNRRGILRSSSQSTSKSSKKKKVQFKEPTSSPKAELQSYPSLSYVSNKHNVQSYPNRGNKGSTYQTHPAVKPRNGYSNNHRLTIRGHKEPRFYNRPDWKNSSYGRGAAGSPSSYYQFRTHSSSLLSRRWRKN